MPIGLFGDAERRRHLDYLDAWYADVQRRELIGRGPFGIHRFGRANESERVDRLESPIMLEVPLGEGIAPVRVELVGRTETVAPHLPASIIPVIRDKPKAKDFLGGFFDAVVLSLLPTQHDPAEHHVDVILSSREGDTAKSHRTFAGIDQRSARKFLTDLIVDLESESHAYLLPCEAVFEYLSKGTPIETSVERMKDNDQEACSSRYGPVPDFERFDPPEEHKTQKIIERRFGLFRDAGGIGQ